MPTRTRQGGGAGKGPRRRPSTVRPQAVLILLALLLAVVGVRLAWMQVVQASELAKAAQQQRTRDVVLPARRGSVFDREGQPLAVTSDARTIYADPRQVVDATATASALANVLGGAAKDYLPKLQRSGSFVYIARKVDLDRAKAVDKLELSGILQYDDSRRSYPGGTLACQILGFVGLDDKGLEGIEKQYDSTLAGTPGRVVAERDRQGRLIPGGIVAATDPVDGQDVFLTIDNDIQFKAQAELAGAVKKFGAKGGSVVVMDPRNGEILAMASTPYFDPNSFGEASPAAMRNRAVTDTYEPGSTIKAMTAAASIDADLFDATSMFRLPATLKVGDRTIHEAHERGTVDYSLSEIVTKSSNIGAVKIGQALGKTRLAKYFASFALSRRTGVDFPGEAKGVMPSPSSWSASSMGNLPFGQGLSITPLQLARSMAVIANGGTLVTPHFLYRQASTPATFPASPERVISSSAAFETVRMLTNVVREGTGIEAKVHGYEVAGKTGTAQKVRPGGTEYMTGGVYISSFAGFLPAGAPQVLIVITIDEPSKGLYGGTVAAPAFSRLAAFCVAHLKIFPAKSIGPTGDPATASGDAGNTLVSTGKQSTEGTSAVLDSGSSDQ
jgi:cell division protein FtsI (penicillin-binding protein 3)